MSQKSQWGYVRMPENIHFAMPPIHRETHVVVQVDIGLLWGGSRMCNRTQLTYTVPAVKNLQPCLGATLYLSAVSGRDINAGAAEYERLQLKVCSHAPLLAQVGQAQVVQIKLRLYRLHQPGLGHIHVQGEDLLGGQAREGRRGYTGQISCMWRDLSHA